MSLEQRVSRLEQIIELQQDKETLRNWMGYCLKREDWRGVMDAAADIREIVAKLEILAEQSQLEPKEAAKSYCSDCNCGKAEGCGA